MTKNRLLQRWRVWRHLQNLIRFRNSGVTSDAADDWLDKEIMDLQKELQRTELSI